MVTSQGKPRTTVNRGWTWLTNKDGDEDAGDDVNGNHDCMAGLTKNNGIRGDEHDYANKDGDALD